MFPANRRTIESGWRQITLRIRKVDYLCLSICMSTCCSRLLEGVRCGTSRPIVRQSEAGQ